MMLLCLQLILLAIYGTAGMIHMSFTFSGLVSASSPSSVPSAPKVCGRCNMDSLSLGICSPVDISENIGVQVKRRHLYAVFYVLYVLHGMMGGIAKLRACFPDGLLHGVGALWTGLLH